MEDDRSSSDTDAHYEWLSLSVASAVVQMDDMLSTKDRKGGSRPGRAPNRDFGRLVAK